MTIYNSRGNQIDIQLKSLFTIIMFSTIKSNQMLVFGERGKPEYPGKNLSEQRREPTNSTHIWCPIRESDIICGPHWRKASALTTAPTLKLGYWIWFLRTDQNGLNKNGLKLGSWFCKEHLQDHCEIDKVGTYKVKGEISVECNRIS